MKDISIEELDKLIREGKLSLVRLNETSIRVATDRLNEIEELNKNIESYYKIAHSITDSELKEFVLHLIGKLFEVCYDYSGELRREIAQLSEENKKLLEELKKMG